MKIGEHTHTNRNLKNAFADESSSFVKYTVWGNEAEKEGYPEIARFYREIANNELEHAEIWMRQLGMTGAVNENMESFIRDEKKSANDYLSYASYAENEGFDSLKNKFLYASSAEKNHSSCGEALYEKYKNEQTGADEEGDRKFKCYNCGYVISEGDIRPCPLCGRPEGWFVEIDK